MEYFQKNPYKYCKEKTRDILNELGIGLSEYVYKRAFEVELKNDGIPYEAEKNILIFYKEDREICYCKTSNHFIFWKPSSIHRLVDG